VSLREKKQIWVHPLIRMTSPQELFDLLARSSNISVDENQPCSHVENKDERNQGSLLHPKKIDKFPLLSLSPSMKLKYSISNETNLNGKRDRSVRNLRSDYHPTGVDSTNCIVPSLKEDSKSSVLKETTSAVAGVKIRVPERENALDRLLKLTSTQKSRLEQRFLSEQKKIERNAFTNFVTDSHSRDSNSGLLEECDLVGDPDDLPPF